MSQLLFRFLGLSLSLTLSLPSTTKYETLKTATTAWPSSNEDRWWDLHKKEGKSGKWRRTQDWNGNGETYKRERSSSSDDEPPICKNGLGFVVTRSSSSSSCCCCCNNCENSQGLGFRGSAFCLWWKKKNTTISEQLQEQDCSSDGLLLSSSSSSSRFWQDLIDLHQELWKHTKRCSQECEIGNQQQQKQQLQLGLRSLPGHQEEELQQQHLLLPRMAYSVAWMLEEEEEYGCLATEAKLWQDVCL